MVHFALVSLIPGLLKRLEDAADPDFDSYERTLVMPTSLKTSDRNSREKALTSNCSWDSTVDYLSTCLYGATIAAVSWLRV